MPYTTAMSPSEHGVRIESLDGALAVPVLPLEIQFLILNQIHAEGRPTHEEHLRSLAFVCPAWAAHIQSLLFRHVTIMPRTRGRFLSLLRESKHIALYVTGVTLLEDVVLLAHEIMDLLPNLRTMHIRGLAMLQPLTELQTKWPAITHVRIMFSLLSGAQRMWDLIGLFPHCERLEFGGWVDQYAPPGASVENLVVAPALHLQILSFMGSSYGNVARWLALNELTVDHLSVVVTELGEFGASAINRLLSRVGHSLQQLDLKELPLYAEPIDAISLALCTNLSSLTVGLHFNIGSPNNIREALSPLLHTVSSPLLATLTFRVSLPASLEEFPFEALEVILAGPHFEGLHRVMFVVPQEESAEFDKFEDAGRGALVRLHEKGLLEFKLVSDSF